MKIVVIGGSGLIGKKVVRNLQARGHDALAASPATGVDVLTGEGLSEILKGAQAVVDLTNSPSFDDTAILTFLRRQRGTCFLLKPPLKSSIMLRFLS